MNDVMNALSAETRERLDEIHARVVEERQVRARLEEKYGQRFVIAGAAFPAAVEHPLGPPVVTNTSLSVDMALNQPTRITHMIMDITLQRFIADRVFTSGGGVTGGAVIYDQVQANELYLDRDIGMVAPGSEFPLVTSERLVPKVATVDKWGGKTYITKEARDRNDVSQLTNRVRQLGNTVVRKINQVAVATLEAAVSANSRQVTGNSWADVVTTGSSASNHTLWPAFDFARAASISEGEELGITYNLWLLNPTDYLNLVSIYGASNLTALLQSLNIGIYVSNRVVAGTAYALASGQVGQMRVEQPLETETWYEEATQRNWIQSSVRPVMFVDNAFAVLKFVGLNA